MSIPKEPRQLLINLMYIVLTALLALNVSAEVLHAFFTMDNSLNESNRIAGSNNRALAEAIGKQADVDERFRSLKEKTAQAQQISTAFFEHVSQLKLEILKAAGGTGKDGMPKRKDDKDIPTRLLVNQGRGKELQKKVLETREQLLALLDKPEDRQRLAGNIPLKINEVPASSDKKTWVQFTFQQMPVAAVMPILTKFQNDVKVAETVILNHFAEQMNIVVKPDQFTPVIATDRNYVIRGEEFRGEIFLAAYSSSADNLSVSVDGRPLLVQDGKAIFTAHPSSIGEKKHEMLIRLTNPLTGQSETFKKLFTYEVGDRSVTASADKMNVLYLGVENPVSISAAGVPTKEVKVTGNGVHLTSTGNGKFIAKPQKPGTATIVVSGGGLQPTTFEYRVKRIPDPVMYLGKSKGGSMNVAEFKVHPGLAAVLEGFDFNAKAEVRSYEVVRLRKGDAATAENRGAKYGDDVRRLVESAQRGDVFFFENIKVHCPGDDFDRKMGSLAFTLK